MILRRPLIGAGVPKIDLSGCVFYAPLWRPDLAGSPFFDQVGHNSCTVTDALWTSQGRTFDGNNDKIVVPNSAALNFTSGDFTILMWIKPGLSGSTYKALINKGDYNVEGYGIRCHSNGRISFYTWQAAAEQVSSASSGKVVANTWALFGVTRHTTTATLYKNGVLTAWDPSFIGSHNDPVTSTQNVIIGENEDGVFDYDGTIGEILFYNKILSAVEVMNNYQATKGRYV